MPEVKREIRTFEVRYQCECGGEMIPTGIVYTSYPSKYPHICGKCEKQITLTASYPKIVYEAKDE